MGFTNDVAVIVTADDKDTLRRNVNENLKLTGKRMKKSKLSLARESVILRGKER